MGLLKLSQFGHWRPLQGFARGGVLVLRAKIALQAADLALVPEIP